MSEHTNPANPKPPSVDRLSQLWRRINDHKMVQWSVAYVALAYGVQHGVVLTSDAFEWPHAVSRISMLLLVLGLPVVMTLAWYHGERASRRISGPELGILSTLLLIASMLFYIFVRPSAELAAGTAPPVRSAVSGLPASIALAGISVAVLPFVNLSSDKEQEFFSDGMTEEITSALAKVLGLNVVARTSAFQFKGQNKDMRAIGQALGATHLIEGSVRKDGNQIRITAQLIKADNGTHLWTESYDRELRGVFAVQEEIAQAIAASLQVPLGLKQGESLVSNRTGDIESYQNYLRAKALVRGRVGFEPGGPLTQAAALLEQVVARDPNYAPAWGLLGQTYALTPIYNAASFNGLTEESRRFTLDLLQKAETAAQNATRLDHNNLDGFIALGLTEEIRGKFLEAEDLYKQTLSLDPGNPDALHRYSIILATVGRSKDALPMRLRLQAQEPLVPVFNLFNAQVLWVNGRNDEAIAILSASTLNGGGSVYYLAMIYASMGRYGEAADALRQSPPGISLPGQVEEAVRLLRAAPAITAPAQISLSLTGLGFVYLSVGALDRGLDFFESRADAGYPALAGIPILLWSPSYAPVRKTERFKAYARKAGLVDYWRERGWPDLCHPTNGDNFECN